MDKYLRWFIKYQVYTIVLFTTLLITIVTPALAYREMGSCKYRKREALVWLDLIA